MKHTGLFLAAWFASAAALSAQQVKVEMKLDQDEFIVGEAIPLTVRIVNYSGQTLRFGDESWINYSVEALEGFVVMKTGEGPMAHNFEIETSKMATLHTDLQPYFTISQAGRYRLRAGVRIRDWDAELNADPVEFEIVRGVKLWEQEFGVPKATNAAAGEPEVRKYSLQKAMYLKHSRLYLRVTDHSEVKVIKVIPLGYVVSF